MARRILMLGGLLAALSPWATAQAQGASSSRSTADSAVPREFMPPENMCRIWLDGVPPTQQPAGAAPWRRGQQAPRHAGPPRAGMFVGSLSAEPRRHCDQPER